MKSKSNKTFFSFGGGRQGTAIAVMLARCPEVFERLDYPLPQHIIFADTGEEPPAVMRNVELVSNLLVKAGYDFHVVSAGKISDTKRGLSTLPLYTRPLYAPPKTEIGMLTRQCTKEFKITPIRNKVREILGVAKGKRMPLGTVNTWMGISIDEVHRAKSSQKKWEILRYPLVDLKLSAAHCIAYIERELGYPPPKSACYFCPMRSPEAWQNMAADDPESFDRAVEFDKQIRHGANTRNPAYLHQWGVPLEMAITPGQLSLFPSNRSGSCDSGYCFN